MRRTRSTKVALHTKQRPTVAPNADGVIGERVIAVRFGPRARALHPYLTWGEGLKLAAQTFTQDVAKLSCCA